MQCRSVHTWGTGGSTHIRGYSSCPAAFVLTLKSSPVQAEVWWLPTLPFMSPTIDRWGCQQHPFPMVVPAVCSCSQASRPSGARTGPVRRLRVSGSDGTTTTCLGFGGSFTVSGPSTGFPSTQSGDHLLWDEPLWPPRCPPLSPRPP